MDKLFALFDRVAYMDTGGDSVTLVRGDAYPGDGKPADGQTERLVKLGAIGSEADLAATVKAGRPVKAADVKAAVEAAADADAAAEAERAAVAKAQGDTAGQAEGDVALAAAAAGQAALLAAQQGAGGKPTPPVEAPAAASPPTPAAMTTTSDPADFSVDVVNDHLTTADETERNRVLSAERAGKARKGILGD